MINLAKTLPLASEEDGTYVWKEILGALEISSVPPENLEEYQRNNKKIRISPKLASAWIGDVLLHLEIESSAIKS